MTKLTFKTTEVLATLRAKAEGDVENGFRLVYLDNALGTLEHLSPRMFAGHLSALEAEGLYKPEDGFAWGWVKIQEAGQ